MEHSTSHVVATADTARALGSGTVDVLATPRLIAWLEADTLKACDVPDGKVSVGTAVNVTHHRATPVGATVTTRAQLVSREGARCEFEVTALDEDGELLMSGFVTRAIVSPERLG